MTTSKQREAQDAQDRLDEQERREAQADAAEQARIDADATSRDNMSHVDETEALPGSPVDYDGKQHFPKVRYHKDHGPRVVASAEEEAALEAAVAGWQDTPYVAPLPATPPDLPGVKA